RSGLYRSDGEISGHSDRVQDRRPAHARARLEEHRGCAGRQSRSESDLCGQRRSRARRHAGDAGGEPRRPDHRHRHEWRADGAAGGEGRQYSNDRRAQPGALGQARRRRARDLPQGRQGRAAGVHQACRNRQFECRRGAGQDGAAQELTRRLFERRPKSTEALVAKVAEINAAETAKQTAAGAGDTSFVAQLEAANLHPLWDRFKKITPVRPQPRDAPLIWRWKDIEPYAERAVGEVAIDDVERRGLILVNPAFAGETVTTSNLIAAFTVLDPGDRARPHRHTFAAIRFATRPDGATTTVNGRRCDMREGDLILPPPMCWHGHINETGRCIIWFDAANIPLIRTLDANFFEPGDSGSNAFWQVDEGEERLWAEPGLAGADLPRDAAHSPKYRYAGEATRRLLAALPAGPDGARTVRYTNPPTG